MESMQQRMFDSLRRVQSFLDEHSALIVSLKDSAGRKQLDKSVDTVASFVGEQAAIDRGLDGAIRLQEAQTKDLCEKHMKPIAEFARARLRGVPDFGALEESGANLSHMSLVRAARAMATAAAGQLHVLVDDGYPTDTIDQLNAAATALESTIAGRGNDRVRRVRATTGIGEALKDGREAVKRLGSVVRRTLADDKALLAGWRVASRVVLKVGAVRAPASSGGSPSSSPAVPATA